MQQQQQHYIEIAAHITKIKEYTFKLNYLIILLINTITTIIITIITTLNVKNYEMYRTYPYILVLCGV